MQAVDPAASPTATGTQQTVISLGAFAAELAILAVLATSGVRLGPDTAAKVSLGIALPAAAASVWSRWMAPRSARRLADPARFSAQVGLFAITAIAAMLAGIPTWGGAVAAISTLIFALTRLPGRLTIAQKHGGVEGKP